MCQRIEFVLTFYGQMALAQILININFLEVMKHVDLKPIRKYKSRLNSLNFGVRIMSPAVQLTEISIKKCRRTIPFFSQQLNVKRKELSELNSF